MLTTIICSVVVLQLIGAAVMIAKMRRAPVGYQDAQGFHRGAEPFVPMAERVPIVERGGQDHSHPSLLSWGAEPHRLAS